MAKWSKVTSLFVVFVFLAVFEMVPPAAAAGPPKLVGTWEVTVYVNGEPGPAPPALFTFTQGGSLIAAASNASFTAAHGAWEKSGPNTFDSKHVWYGLDENGNAAVIYESNTTHMVSQDGKTLASEFTVTVTFVDGTGGGTVSGTSVGTRLTVD